MLTHEHVQAAADEPHQPVRRDESFYPSADVEEERDQHQGQGPAHPMEFHSLEDPVDLGGGIAPLFPVLPVFRVHIPNPRNRALVPATSSTAITTLRITLVGAITNKKEPSRAPSMIPRIDGTVIRGNRAPR